MKKVGEMYLPDSERLMVPDFEASNGFQLDRLNQFLSHVHRFRTAVDGGAHAGSWSKAMSYRFDNVVSFEPAPDTFEVLETNVCESNVTLYNKALADKHTHVSMQMEEKDIARGNTGGRYVSMQETGIEAIPLDDLELKGVDFIKLDVEGAELLALLGAVDTISRCHPVVMIEDKKGLAERFGHRRGDAARFLESLGMKEIDRIKADRLFAF